MSKTIPNQVVPHRRLLLKGLATLPMGLSAAAAQAARDPHLAFRHTHTEERLRVASATARATSSRPCSAWTGSCATSELESLHAWIPGSMTCFTH